MLAHVVVALSTQQSTSQDISPLFGGILLLFLTILLIGGFCIYRSAKQRWNAQFEQEVIHTHKEGAVRLATRQQDDEPETEPLLPVPVEQRSSRVRTTTVLAAWLHWWFIRWDYPAQDRKLHKQRHFHTLIAPQRPEEEEEHEEEDEIPIPGLKLLTAPGTSTRDAWVEPLSGKSYNYPGLLEQDERVFRLALEGAILRAHWLYHQNGRKITREGFVGTPSKDSVDMRARKFTQVEWAYLFGSKDQPGLFREAALIQIDEDTSSPIWPYESPIVALNYLEEWLQSYIQDERDERLQHTHEHDTQKEGYL